MLGVHASLLAWSAAVHSPNANEPSHLAAGIAHWRTGRFDLYRVNPPLIRMVASLPVLAAGVRTDWSRGSPSPIVRSEFLVGPDLIAANGVRSIALTRLARWACLPFSLLGGLVCYWWARDLFGEPAGLVSCALWCFCPNILGHASCLTPDAHAAALGVAAQYLFWRWMRRPAWTGACASGVLLGLALLAKSTWIVLLPLWPALWCLLALTSSSPATGGPATTRRGQFCQLGLLMLLGIQVLNLGYLFNGSFRRLGDIPFTSEALNGLAPGSLGNRFRGTRLARIPVPFPADFVQGIDIQKRFHESRPSAYRNGAVSDRGVWWFYVYAFLLKVPIGTMGLAALALRRACTAPRDAQRGADGIILLSPALLILLVASLETDCTAHLRYVLPAFPFVFIAISRAGQDLAAKSVSRPLAAAALAWSIGSSLAQAPHGLSYFNEFAGGPANGHSHLADSNLDWGQDLLFLQDWQVRHPETGPIHLAYYGMFHPRAIGVEFRDVPRGTAELPPGWYAISVNFVVGLPFWVNHADGSREWLDGAPYRRFHDLEPVDRAGRSILIYHVTEDDARRLATPP